MAGYFSWRKYLVSERSNSPQALLPVILQTHHGSGQLYGSPVDAALRQKASGTTAAGSNG
jgi:hypothetical protein